MKSVKELPKRFPALSEVEARAYSDGIGPFITSRATFRFDPSRGWNTFALNLEAGDFVVTDFLDTVKGGQAYNNPPLPARYLTRELVAAALSVHINHLRAEFKRLTAEQTPEHVAQQLKIKSRKNANARQQTVRVLIRESTDYSARYTNGIS